MYRPTIKSNLWLGLMTLTFIALYYWSEHSRETVKPTDYSEKLAAASIMQAATDALIDYRLPGAETPDAEIVVDPLIFTMLGEKDSPITTDEGRVEDKITVLNPNFAAVVVDMLNQAELTRGDTIAVLLTGSMPGANIATFSAAIALGLHPVIITSVGSSWWGANLPDFTWLDMERILYDREIFNFRSIAASAGGSDDHGGLRLSELGRQLIEEAIVRNNITYLKEGSLSTNKRGRMEMFNRAAPLSSYKVVINVGGGIAAVGDSELIPFGFNKRLPKANYPNPGVIHYFDELSIPVVHIASIAKIAEQYDLPIAKLPLPEVGIGPVYEHKRYNLTSAATALILMFLILVVVKYFDRQRYKWREEQSDADQSL